MHAIATPLRRQQKSRNQVFKPPCAVAQGGFFLLFPKTGEPLPVERFSRLWGKVRMGAFKI